MHFSIVWGHDSIVSGCVVNLRGGCLLTQGRSEVRVSSRSASLLQIGCRWRDTEQGRRRWATDVWRLSNQAAGMAEWNEPGRQQIVTINRRMDSWQLLLPQKTLIQTLRSTKRTRCGDNCAGLYCRIAWSSGGLWEQGVRLIRCGVCDVMETRSDWELNITKSCRLSSLDHHQTWEVSSSALVLHVSLLKVLSLRLLAPQTKVTKPKTGWGIRSFPAATPQTIPSLVRPECVEPAKWGGCFLLHLQFLSVPTPRHLTSQS